MFCIFEAPWKNEGAHSEKSNCTISRFLKCVMTWQNLIENQRFISEIIINEWKCVCGCDEEMETTL